MDDFNGLKSELARNWAMVLETPSPAVARAFGKILRAEGIDVEVEAAEARVWCFADDEQGALLAREVVLRLAEGSPQPPLRVAPMLRVWSEDQYRYVDPQTPDEDPDTGEVWIESDFAPQEVSWQVRLTLETVFDFRRVRRQLPQLRRPVIATGNRHIDLGTRDRADADQTAARASALEGVRSAEPSQIRGRLRRWLVRQRLAGNYASGDDGLRHGYAYADFGGGGDLGGGHGGHGGGGGHGGH